MPAGLVQTEILLLLLLLLLYPRYDDDVVYTLHHHRSADTAAAAAAAAESLSEPIQLALHRRPPAARSRCVCKIIFNALLICWLQ